MNIGSELIRCEEQKQEVARLNVLAGQKAIRELSFHSAAKYLLAAIALQEEESAIEIYDLSLKPLFCVGNFETLEIHTEKVLALSESYEEKERIHVRINAYSHHIKMLTMVGKHEGKGKHLIDGCRQHATIANLSFGLPYFAIQKR